MLSAQMEKLFVLVQLFSHAKYPNVVISKAITIGEILNFQPCYSFYYRIICTPHFTCVVKKICVLCMWTVVVVYFNLHFYFPRVSSSTTSLKISSPSSTLHPNSSFSSSIIITTSLSLSLWTWILQELLMQWGHNHAMFIISSSKVHCHGHSSQHFTFFSFSISSSVSETLSCVSSSPDAINVATS